MKKIRHQFKIGYSTKRSDIPSWLYYELISMDGPGFKLKSVDGQHQWFRTVVKYEDGTFAVINDDDIAAIKHNATLF